MGLLDNFNIDDPRTMGLLSAGLTMLGNSGASRTPANLGQILGSGLQAYTGTQDDFRKRKQQEEELAQMAQMRNLQLQQNQLGLGQLQQQIKDQEASRRFQSQLPEIVAQYGGDINAMKRDLRIPQDVIKRFEEEVARVEEVADAQGNKVKRMFSKTGMPIGQDMPAYIAPVQIDRGDRIEMVIPSAGQSFKVGLSPSDMRAENRFNRQMEQSERFHADKMKQGLGGDRKPMTALQESKYRDQMAGDYKALDAAIATMNDVSRSSQNLLENKKGLSGVTGLQSYFPSYPNSAAAKADVSLQNLKGKITQLGKVAASSGGAIGAIANQEWKIMSDMVAAIDPAKGDEPMKQQIAELNSYAEGAARRMADAYDKQYSVDFEAYPQFKTPSLVDVSRVPRDAVNMLKMNPKLRNDFDAKYGAGAASRILGQ